MRFGRVIGQVVAYDNTLELRVTLDTGGRVETVRHGDAPYINGSGKLADLDWQADQYTQETIGNELALLGWEAIADEPSTASLPGVGVSATYIVRNLGGSG